MKSNPVPSGRLYLLGASIVLLVLFARLFINLLPGLGTANEALFARQALTLRDGLKSASILSLLTTGNYYADQKDGRLVADSLAAKLSQQGSLDNLGAINKRQFSILAPVSWRSRIGGPDFQSRLALSRQQMGFDSVLYVRELNNPKPYGATMQAGVGSASIAGQVLREEQPVAGVLVQLKQHPATAQPDTLPNRFVYARTDTDGRFRFSGLADGSGYSVVPLKPGFEFGSRRGASRLTSDQEYTFSARPHHIRLIGSVVYGQLKADHALGVRTPNAYMGQFWAIVFLFFGLFWLIQGFWATRRFHPDPLLLPILMLLTGISVLTLLAIQDPLQDTLYAWQTVQGVGAGLVGMAIVSQLNIGRFYADWRFDWLFAFRNRNTVRLSGWTWLVLAVGLAALTLFVGSGPEGSGVRVNLSVLGLTIQPSEITKFLLLLFFAGFFAANEQQIRQLPDLRWRFAVSAGALAGAGLLMLLYLLLGDMGPALVVCFTFLLFYSIARGNLPLTLATGVAYGFALWLLPGWLATLICLGGVVGYLFWRGEARSTTGLGWAALLTEAPILLLLVMAMFAFGDLLPFVGDRLADRKAMWLSPWNNDVYGGDHLAHAMWTLASGGWSGQGLGKGFANAMPAAHTDMILPSVGEELGGLGVIAVFLLFGVLLHRIFLHARQAGQPFAFFLVAGIAISTGVQFLIIAGGSIGLLPLTGISVPFLSYGKISLIINLMAMGVVFSVASRPGQTTQREYLSTHYDVVLMAGIAGFLLGVVILIGRLLPIIGWRGNEYIVRPARVITRNGDPVYSYNPRIERLTRALASGTIYDRNGLVLATSTPEQVTQQASKLRKSGLRADQLQALSQKRLQRYYPFGDQLFFWVGDLNTQLFWGQSNGYYAEATHFSELRGFNSRPRKTELVTTDYRADRFSPSVEQTRTLSVYDYRELAPALRAGIDSREVDRRKARNRDLHLSVNAELQVALQNALAQSEYRDKRLSVVVLDAASGDVLSSAMHPLPNLKTPETMLLADRDRLALPYLVTERDLGMTFPTAPGSTAKILTAMAAFTKLGSSASAVSYPISCQEIIRRGARESEPCNQSVDMRKAIVRSSNVYFIRTANDNKLDNEMASLYLATGMNVDMVGGYSFSDTHTDPERKKIMQHWRDSSFVVRRNLYQSNRYPRRYRGEFSGLAWGQGQLTATPVSLARMAGAIANKGLMQPSRYVLDQAGKAQPVPAGRSIGRPAYADQLQAFMIEQSNPGAGRSKISAVRVAGKTGTPERIVQGIQRNDGWYVFFAPTPDGRSKTVVSVRIELGESSADAVNLANTIVAPILQERGYLGSF
ncbi:FtsW/RodA/SpoVE family cell cycle protein [Spirosoma utsteinense]|uniref:Cell division protein FtsW/cell division protein FtsI/penicillin-binding protein 2 n=1 Tax=Spirosoma utsteinense TaxID=2585773 RepID=A0ABR6WDB9_9BACT|nr:FtsW/RodA/SpoVE family cell cycle protein [Spirosoma utsteinense]MBC3788748.1 cell division protein FtsW (lipid II flippase)/cell division protein FtsI [Spirosoma utsteinense]MBC3794522.1 cell division protein FtsW/cell division protein FtsI/penicillin-binding protein 2 [Spirosoma utsteinense]